MTETYLSDAQIAARIGVSRNSVWRWVRNGTFPKPIKLSERVTRWRASEVEAWAAERERAA